MTEYDDELLPLQATVTIINHTMHMHAIKNLRPTKPLLKADRSILGQENTWSCMGSYLIFRVVLLNWQ
jgi:hypothetical protein